MNDSSWRSNMIVSIFAEIFSHFLIWVNYLRCLLLLCYCWCCSFNYESIYPPSGCENLWAVAAFDKKSFKFILCVLSLNYLWMIWFEKYFILFTQVWDVFDFFNKIKIPNNSKTDRRQSWTKSVPYGWKFLFLWNLLFPKLNWRFLKFSFRWFKTFEMWKKNRLQGLKLPCFFHFWIINIQISICYCFLNDCSFFYSWNIFLFYDQSG